MEQSTLCYTGTLLNLDLNLDIFWICHPEQADKPASRVPNIIFLTITRTRFSKIMCRCFFLYTYLKCYHRFQACCPSHKRLLRNWHKNHHMTSGQERTTVTSLSEPGLSFAGYQRQMAPTSAPWAVCLPRVSDITSGRFKRSWRHLRLNGGGCSIDVGIWLRFAVWMHRNSGVEFPTNAHFHRSRRTRHRPQYGARLLRSLS